MSSNNADASSSKEQKPSSSDAKSQQQQQQQQPAPAEQLGSLEEDDEFEEFPAEDWPESQTTLAALTAGVGAGGDPSAHLWEDNWDDDDKEPKFTQQLRAELQSRSNPDAMRT